MRAYCEELSPPEIDGLSSRQPCSRWRCESFGPVQVQGPGPGSRVRVQGPGPPSCLSAAASRD